jgi:hypothetical protein
MATLKQINNATLKALNESDEITTVDIYKNFFDAFKTIKIQHDIVDITVEFLEPQSIRGDKETITVNVPWETDKETSRQKELFYGIIQWVKQAFAKKYRQYKKIEIIDENGQPARQIIEDFVDEHHIQRIITLYGIDSMNNEQDIGAFALTKKVR